MENLCEKGTRAKHVLKKIWLVLLLAYIISNIHRVGLAVILDQLMAEFKINNAAIAGSLSGMLFFVYLLMQLPTGFLADMWGPRKTITCGMCIAFIGTLVFVSARCLSVVYIGLGAIGLGISVIYVCVLKFQVSWFSPSEYASATGITLLVGNIGGIIGTAPLAYLVTKVGWRGSYFIIAVATLILAVLCWFVVRDSPGDVQDKPEYIDNKAKVSWKEMFKAFADIFRNRNIWFLLFGIFGIAGTLYAFTGTWSFAYLMQVYGFERGEAAKFMLIVAVGKVIGFPISGFAADRITSRKKPTLLFFVLYTAIWAVLWWNGKLPQNVLYVVLFMMGLFSGGVLTLFPVMAKELNDPNYAGLAISVVTLGTYTGASVLQPLMGYILDIKWDGDMLMGLKIYSSAAYETVFGFCFILLLICFGFVLMLKDINQKQALKG